MRKHFFDRHAEHVLHDQNGYERGEAVIDQMNESGREGALLAAHVGRLQQRVHARQHKRHHQCVVHRGRRVHVALKHREKLISNTAYNT